MKKLTIGLLAALAAGLAAYSVVAQPAGGPGGLVLAHNMNPRQADARYVKAITTEADLETIFLHVQAGGVGVTLKKR